MCFLFFILVLIFYMRIDSDRACFIIIVTSVLSVTVVMT